MGLRKIADIGYNNAMNFVSRGVALIALFGAASCALAQSTITFQYIVPANGVWPPTTFSPTGTWNTVGNALNQPATPGIQIPGIDLAYDIANVPLSWRQGLLSVDLVVDGFARVAYTVDNGDPVNGGNETTTLTGTLTVKEPTITAPGSFPSGSSTILTVVSTANETKSTTASTEGGSEVPDFQGTDTASGILVAQNNQTGTYTTGATFNAFNSSGLVYLPIQFEHNANVTGSGNYAIDGVTFGAARVTITYTYLPESQLAWVGLPLVLGGWLVRRKLTAVTVNF